ncbi:MAG: hypothetical protein ACYCU7_18295 [Acidimicrobiales bacterium]
MIVTCPRCGLAFETEATTNTRCRRCKSVVQIGRGPGKARSTPSVTDSTGPDERTDPAGDPGEDRGAGPSSPGPSPEAVTLLTAVLVAVIRDLGARRAAGAG